MEMTYGTKNETGSEPQPVRDAARVGDYADGELFSERGDAKAIT
jgi:hypothetical protein